MRVRFWIHWNGSDCRITLSEGKPINLYRAWSHEEGRSSVGVSYRLEDGIVYESNYTDGRDCDGRLSTESHFFCPIANLNRYTSAVDGLTIPLWEKIDSSQRDYSAEAAGY